MTHANHTCTRVRMQCKTPLAASAEAGARSLKPLWDDDLSWLLSCQGKPTVCPKLKSLHGLLGQCALQSMPI